MRSDLFHVDRFFRIHLGMLPRLVLATTTHFQRRANEEANAEQEAGMADRMDAHNDLLEEQGRFGIENATLPRLGIMMLEATIYSGKAPRPFNGSRRPPIIRRGRRREG